ncbi:substrate-binding domain-containing protein [Dendrosporobacter sp. 1207_IL3150]|uniref:substrate-binding domain-containing protein n=1 Tax=Dendrosporobacter sp. 1207_IL3150 TaxID=3084054 RepID=UPI002FD8F798
MRVISLIMLLCLSISLMGCGSTSSQYINFEKQKPIEKNRNNGLAEQRPIRIALATVISPNETIANYRKIAEYISSHIGRPAVLIQRKTYEEVNMLMSNGEADIAFMSTGAFCAYRGLTEIEILSMAEFEGTTLYKAQIIVHKDSDIKSLSDLQGRTFAFTDPLSYSGHMAIVDLLKDQNVRPEKYFSRYIYTYSHDKSIWAVATKAVEAASLDSMIFDYAQIRTPALTENLRTISYVGPVPTGPVVINKKLSQEQKEQLQKIFLEMHQDLEMSKALKGLLIDKFVLPNTELYRPLQRLYEQTGGLI